MRRHTVIMSQQNNIFSAITVFGSFLSPLAEGKLAQVVTRLEKAFPLGSDFECFPPFEYAGNKGVASLAIQDRLAYWVAAIN